MPPSAGIFFSLNHPNPSPRAGRGLQPRAGRGLQPRP